MTLLDRYIARQYLTNIAALLVILACFVVAIDVSLNLNRYWEQASKLCAQTPVTDSTMRRALLTPLLVLDLWWPRLLSLFNFLLGLVLVGAMGFTCTQLVRHRELVAVLTAGQSLFRVARPIVLVAVGMIAVQALNQELVIPRIAPLLTRDQGDAGKRDLGSARVPPTVDAKGRVFYAAAFDADREVLTDLYIWDRDETGVALNRIHAASAVWRGRAWELSGAAVEARADARDPGPPPARIETDLDPTMLKMKQFAGYGQNLSWAQASEMLRRLDKVGVESEESRKTRDRLTRATLGRVSTVCSNLLTLLISMSFFLTRVPRSMVVQSLKCAPIGIVALMGAVLGTSATVPGVPTALSVFIPTMVLIPIAIAMVSRVRS